MRLRAAAITALSQDTKTDKATIFQLAHQFLNLSERQRSGTEVNNPASDVYYGAITGEDLNHQVYESEYLNDSQGSYVLFLIWYLSCEKLNATFTLNRALKVVLLL